MKVLFFTAILLPLGFGLAATSAAHANSLPEGEAKPLVQQLCSSCHQSNRINQSSGYSRAGWQELISSMIDLSEHPSQALIISYLAEHFPAHNQLSPTLVAGNSVINFKEWLVPTLGQRARDPIQAADGSIWWAGQWANVIGRIDPKTGEMEEFALPAGAMPHTVTVDGTGNIWYTGNKNGTVGRFAPETGKITEYAMPDPAAKDPHSAIFDRHGRMWFTLQHSNQVGRLSPATGEIKLISMPTANSRPYGIKIDGNDNPWVACNGSNCLVKVDATTMAVQEYKLPDVKTKIRRLDFSSDGMVWYVNSSQGRLGQFNPVTGKSKEWPSPSGTQSHPYAIAVIDDIIWYNESGMRPDTLVRLDPKTEQFQSWPIPSGGIYAGIVRHMRPTAEGNLLIHQGSTNRIILVTISDEQ
ncbi:Vgb family protein [Rheinheimera salexigens]|uniref:Cytochrome C n=1 Tax=Rheinheimera salexigens TaxID=1628148 RepID=A0A1E7Q8L6_9GAMM|nr:cytochrome C [Rheinheimera salexigens]OEY70470.1 cytochrome C [Rheinheimera salexigens]